MAKNAEHHVHGKQKNQTFPNHTELMKYNGDKIGT